MTFNERIALVYLSSKMEATAIMIGHAIWGKCQSYPAQRAGGVLRSLNKRGLIMHIPELKAWRLTRKGREWVSQANNGKSDEK